MKKYKIIEKHIEIQEIGETKVYYDIIEEFTTTNNIKANDIFKRFVDNYTDKHGSFSGDKYYLVEIVSEVYIK